MARIAKQVIYILVCYITYSKFLCLLSPLLLLLSLPLLLLRVEVEEDYVGQPAQDNSLHSGGHL